jgi:hypothetical protein
MPATIDLNDAFLTRAHGDLLTVYTWVNDERAIIIIPHLRTKAPWFIVCESSLPDYNDVRQAARKGMLACDVLGIESSVKNAMRIVGLVVDGTEDLIRMPSKQPPRLSKAAHGEVTMKDAGVVIAEHELHPEIEQGAAYG